MDEPQDSLRMEAQPLRRAFDSIEILCHLIFLITPIIGNKEEQWRILRFNVASEIAMGYGDTLNEEAAGMA
ncbi:MAG: hypothetical protein ACREUF_09790 [Solimonas sp.]